MCINVACCADVAVTEPLLNLFQAHTIGVEQAGAAMAKVMETDAFHVVRNKEIGKMLGKIIRMKAHSHRVHIDVVEIIGANPPFCRFIRMQRALLANHTACHELFFV